MINIKPKTNQAILNKDLIVAVKGNDIEKVMLLLKVGADVEAKDHGKTALMIAIKNGNLQLAAILRGRGANLLAKDNRGLTSFEIAIENGHRSTAMMLARWEHIINYHTEHPFRTFLYYKFWQPLILKKDIFMHNISLWGSAHAW